MTATLETGLALAPRASWGAMPEGATWEEFRNGVWGWHRSASVTIPVERGGLPPLRDRCQEQAPWTAAAACYHPEGHDGIHSALCGSYARSLGERGDAREWTSEDTKKAQTDAEVVAVAPASTPTDDAPEGYVSVERLREAIREQAIKHNWCSEYHEALRELGIDPLPREITLKVSYETTVTISRDEYMSGSAVEDWQGLGASTRRMRDIRQSFEATLRGKISHIGSYNTIGFSDDGLSIESIRD